MMSRFLNFLDQFLTDEKTISNRNLKQQIEQLKLKIEELSRGVNALAQIVGTHNVVLSELSSTHESAVKSSGPSTSTRLPDIYPEKNKKPN